MGCFYLYFYDEDKQEIYQEQVFDWNRGIHNPDDCYYYNMDFIKKELTVDSRDDDRDYYLYSLENLLLALQKATTSAHLEMENVEDFEQVFKEIYQVSTLISVALQLTNLMM